jgi:hypothetical protein
METEYATRMPGRRVKLDRKWTEYLLGRPEQGMGSQRVKLNFEDGTSVNCPVFNASEMDLPEGFAGKTIVGLTNLGEKP